MPAGSRDKEFTLSSGNGPAILIRDLEDISFQFEGISGDDLSIQTTNHEGQRAAIPAGAWDPVSPNITADQSVKLQSGPMYARVVKTTGVTAVTIRFTGRLAAR